MLVASSPARRVVSCMRKQQLSRRRHRAVCELPRALEHRRRRKRRHDAGRRQLHVQRRLRSRPHPGQRHRALRALCARHLCIRRSVHDMPRRGHERRRQRQRKRVQVRHDNLQGGRLACTDVRRRVRGRARALRRVPARQLQARCFERGQHAAMRAVRRAHVSRRGRRRKMRPVPQLAPHAWGRRIERGRMPVRRGLRGRAGRRCVRPLSRGAFQGRARGLRLLGVRGRFVF